MNVDRRRDISLRNGQTIILAQGLEEDAEFMRISATAEEGYAKIELLAVRKPRHRDDGDPPANSAWKTERRYSRILFPVIQRCRSVVRNGPGPGSSRGYFSLSSAQDRLGRDGIRRNQEAQMWRWFHGESLRKSEMRQALALFARRAHFCFRCNRN